MLGLTIIALAALVALLGYAILPDASPNANAAVPALQKQPPGFTVPMVRVRRPDAPLAGSFFELLLDGREPAYRLVPAARVVRGEPNRGRRAPPARRAPSGRPALDHRATTRKNYPQAAHPAAAPAPSAP